MRCDDVRELLSAALDGEAAISRTARAHLAGCAPCRAWHAEVTELERLFSAPVTVPRDVVPRVTHRLLVLGPKARRTAGRALLVAALVAIPAGTAAARLRDRPARPPAQQARVAPGVTTPPGTPAARPATPPPTRRPVPTTAPATGAPRPSTPAAPPATRAGAPPTAKPQAAEIRDGALLLRLTAPAAQNGVLTATLALTNEGADPVTYDAPCADLLVVVDGEAAGPAPAPDCEGIRSVTLAPGETRRVTYAAPHAPGAYAVRGTFFSIPPPGERSGRLDTPSLRVAVS